MFEKTIFFGKIEIMMFIFRWACHGAMHGTFNGFRIN